jgi:hypothetical protein
MYPLQYPILLAVNSINQGSRFHRADSRASFERKFIPLKSLANNHLRRSDNLECLAIIVHYS